MKIKKRTVVILYIALAMCIVSMLGSWQMQAGWGKNRVSTFTGTLSELAGMIEKNNAKAGKSINVTFTKNSIYNFSFMTLVPSNATESNPVPAIVCSHGWSNTKEMQMPFYIELARRGFVVITIDMAGHGRSDNAISGLTHGSAGFEAAIEYAMSLPFVNQKQVGVTGHSMGNMVAYAAIAQLNKADSTQRIAAWVEGAGSKPAPDMTDELRKDLIWTISTDKYDEFDSIYFSSANIMKIDLGKKFIKDIFPAFNLDEIPDGQWYTSEGPVSTPTNGQALGVKTAIRLLNPPLTHPAYHFSRTGTKITIDGFYAAFGVPGGASYINSGNQVWPIRVAFELLGLIAFFMLLFPLVDIFVAAPIFSKIKREVAEKESLPSIKNPREWGTLAITISALLVFSFFTYYPLYPKADYLFNPTNYPCSVANGVGIWTIACGLFAIFMISVNYFMRKLAYTKSAALLGNPFASAGLDSLSQFFRTLLFAGVVVVLMFIPVYIAYNVFNVDFRICSFIVTAANPIRFFPVIVRYIPIWLLFYLPNAIMNANTRYKDLPEWASTLICAVANSLALIIFIIIQYGTMFSTNALWNNAAGMAGIVAFAVVPCLFYAAYSARYIYKKTGNAWAAGLINATVMAASLCFANSWAIDMAFPF